MDDDLEAMSREPLIAEVIRLRRAIRAHRDLSAHDLCWYQPELWGTLPDARGRLPVVPDWPQFMEGCIRYRRSLDDQAPGAPHTDEPYGGERDTGR